MEKRVFDILKKLSADKQTRTSLSMSALLHEYEYMNIFTRRTEAFTNTDAAYEENLRKVIFTLNRVLASKCSCCKFLFFRLSCKKKTWHGSKQTHYHDLAKRDSPLLPSIACLFSLATSIVEFKGFQ